MLMTIILVAIVVFSVVIHEVSHGLMAYRLGDPTARLQGRLTLNPLKHIDPIGTVLVPIITYMAGFPFGWAKPVPYNPYNLKNKRVGELLIALAGPASNIVIALITSGIIRLMMQYDFSLVTDPQSFVKMLSYIVLVNIALAIFNLIPVPPLDGSKILFAFIPQKLNQIRYILEAYSFLWVILIVLFAGKWISPVVYYVMQVFMGV